MEAILIPGDGIEQLQIVGFNFDEDEDDDREELGEEETEEAEESCDYDFVEPPPNRLICHICYTPCHKAQLLECCSRAYCKSCLDTWELQSLTDNHVYICPMRCSEPYKRIAFLEADRSIKSLKVYCPSKQHNSGCEWEGELCNVRKHLEQCKLIERCKYCTASFTHFPVSNRYSVFVGHTKQCKCRDCRNLNLECSCLCLCPNNCGEEISPHEIGRHKKTCLYEEIFCEYCQYRMLRKDLKQHNVEKEVEHSRISLENLLRRLNEGNAVQLINSISETSEKQKSSYKEMTNSIAKLWNYVHMIYAILIALLAIFAYDHIQNVKTHICDPWSSTLQHASEKAWYGNQVAPVILKVPDFTNMIKKYEKWSNNSFLTFAGGYRMCLVVKQKPISKDNNISTISANLHLMKGPHDDQLQSAGQWPLSGNFTIELLNQLNDSNHYSHAIVLNKFTCKDCVYRVTQGEMARSGYGVKFLPYERYLKDDTLYFRISYKMDLLRMQNMDMNLWPILLKYYSKKSLHGTEIAPVIFKMSNFTYTMNKNEKWSSSPFYTFIEGYKMFLTVKRKIIKNGDTLSASLYLMKGPHDDRLRTAGLWPLSGNFTIELINQLGDGGHYSQTISYTCSNYFQHVKESKKIQYGYEVYFPLYEMYLKDETLYFRVAYKIDMLKMQNLEANPWPLLLKHYGTKSTYGNEVAPVILEMSDFTHVTNRYQEWSSIPFMVFTKGYRMHLAVKKNTISKGISVCLYLMKGPHDDHLQNTGLWPLSGNFTIELLNQLSDRDHYSQIIAYTCSGCMQQTKEGKKAKYGYEVSFPLYETHLKDDILYFRVSYVT